MKVDPARIQVIQSYRESTDNSLCLGCEKVLDDTWSPSTTYWGSISRPFPPHEVEHFSAMTMEREVYKNLVKDYETCHDSIPNQLTASRKKSVTDLARHHIFHGCAYDGCVQLIFVGQRANAAKTKTKRALVPKEDIDEPLYCLDHKQDCSAAQQGEKHHSQQVSASDALTQAKKQRTK